MSINLDSCSTLLEGLRLGDKDNTNQALLIDHDSVAKILVHTTGGHDLAHIGSKLDKAGASPYDGDTSIPNCAQRLAARPEIKDLVDAVDIIFSSQESSSISGREIMHLADPPGQCSDYKNEAGIYNRRSSSQKADTSGEDSDCSFQFSCAGRSAISSYGVGSVDEKAPANKTGILSIPQCIIANVALYRELNRNTNPEIIALEEACSSYLQSNNTGQSHPWVIKSNEFSTRFRCPFAAYQAQPGDYTGCLLVNTKDLHGIRTHIKGYHPDVYEQTLPLETWNQIFDVCLPQAKPNPYPSPCFDLNLVREKYKAHWSFRTDKLYRPRVLVTRGHQQRGPTDVSSAGEVTSPDSQFMGYQINSSQDVPSIFSSFQAILHIRLSFLLERDYIQLFEAGRTASRPWKTSSPGDEGSWSHYPGKINSSRYSQRGSVGRRNKDQVNEEDNYGGNGDEDDDESEGGGRRRDEHYEPPQAHYRIACPLYKLGYPDLPCPRPKGQGRKYGGSQTLAHLRQHIRQSHRDLWPPNVLDSIGNERTRSWPTMFRRLFPLWPKSEPLPDMWCYGGSPTVHEKWSSSPHSASKLQELLIIVQPLFEFRRIIQGLRPGEEMGLEGTGQYENVAHDVSNPLPDGRDIHPGPDLQNTALNSQPEPDQGGVAPENGIFFVFGPPQPQNYPLQDYYSLTQPFDIDPESLRRNLGLGFDGAISPPTAEAHTDMLLYGSPVSPPARQEAFDHTNAYQHSPLEGTQSWAQQRLYEIGWSHILSEQPHGMQNNHNFETQPNEAQETFNNTGSHHRVPPLFMTQQAPPNMAYAYNPGVQPSTMQQTSNNIEYSYYPQHSFSGLQGVPHNAGLHVPETLPDRMQDVPQDMRYPRNRMR
ncbi:hypothetical protein TWF730_008484 [Orbilia blumenaviensis]|uniref:Uncharacterized protein n=1 Tax=Orbilia blumenaviensis TaxID=1796055 RepID=A0AAV9V2L5_9PEZI